MQKPTLKTFGLLAATLCVGALLLVSCSKKPQQAILGKWNVQGQQVVVEFRNDGTMISSEKGHDTVDKYLFLDDSHVQMDMTGTSGTNTIKIRLTCGVDVHGDNADITVNIPGRAGAPGVSQVVHYTRIK